MPEVYDFTGWATRNDLRCSDGRTIRRDAFKHNDGQIVPLVWNHMHNDPNNILGKARLENRPQGVYAYCTFNETESGLAAKELVKHGDIRSLSIYANRLKQNGGDVLHGDIKELSLVLAGANPEAFIDSVLIHGEISDEEAIIGTGEDPAYNIELCHAEEENENMTENIAHADEQPEKEKTIGDIIDSMNEEQKNVLYALLGMQAEANEKEDNDGGNESMKHNVFESDAQYPENVLTHADMENIIRDAKRCGSLKEAFIAHADGDETAAPYGITNMDYLFPEDHNLNIPPEFIKYVPDDWVKVVMNGVHHTPFSRIKSMFADLTEDEARAKGYIKGKRKKEEVFSLLKRSTSPTTIYKKQKMDRDDIIDITDFDVIAWLKKEMRMMLDEEIARAILIGDGRLSSSDDKINESNIRPIINDADLFVIRYGVAAGADLKAKAKNFIDAAIMARGQYRGSGNPILFTSETFLTAMLMIEDGIGHKLYKTESELATAMRVSRIVTVPYLDNCTDSDSKQVYGIIVNLNDYNVGADKGGAVSMFDDFDIDYNQQKYLIETRCSGALVKPFSAIVLRAGTGSENASEAPSLKDAMDEFRA